MKKAVENKVSKYYTEKSEKKYEVHYHNAEGAGLHFHNYLELELVVDGESTQYLNDYKIDIKRGTLYVLRPNIDCHSIDYHPFKVYKFYTNPFFIDEKIWKEICILPNPLATHLEGEELDNFIRIFEVLLYEQNHRSPYSDLISQNLINSCLAYFIKAMGGDQHINEKKKEMINFLLENNNYLTDVSLEDFSKHFSYSLSHASKIFKENVGMTFSNEKQFLRIQYAKKLLLTTDKSINEISLECGFNYYPLFHNSFKKSTGMTPHEFKKNNLKSN